MCLHHHNYWQRMENIKICLKYFSFVYLLDVGVKSSWAWESILNLNLKIRDDQWWYHRWSVPIYVSSICVGLVVLIWLTSCVIQNILFIQFHFLKISLIIMPTIVIVDRILSLRIIFCHEWWLPSTHSAL